MKRWVTSWGYDPMAYERFPIEVCDETQCIVFLNNIAGERARVRLSNAYSTRPLVLDWVRLVEVSNDTVDVQNGSSVTLGGASRIILAPGQTMLSDEVALPVHAGKRLAVITYLRERALVETACSCFAQDCTGVMRWAGECNMMESRRAQTHAARTALLSIEPEHHCFYGVTQVLIEGDESVKTLACYGDSITHRSLWTSPLTKRLYDRFQGRVSVVNHGISGNRALHDESPFSKFGKWFGPCGRDRFESDVFGNERVDCVTVLQGINDIFHPLCGDAPASETVTADELIAGLTAMCDVAHAHDAKACGCTITPFKNAMELWNREAERVRLDVNDWLRHASPFDACFDFDLSIRDPDDPARMMPAFDSGDNVHPGALGGEKIAQGIDLDTLQRLLNL